MGTADIVTKEYMRGNAVFADAFNYLIYNGKKVIDPAKLKEIDPTEIALPFDDEEKAGKEKDGEDKNRKAQGTEWSSVKNESVRKKTAGRAGKKTDTVQRYRDLLKFAVIKQDERTSYVLLGIENQTDVHYAMPVRNAIYDALQYGRQVADIAAGHRRNKNDFSGKNNGEYLSGFLKEDHIRPVITLVIHFGAEEWDGPLSLHEMMSTRDMELLSFVENYRIHLIDPAKLTEEQLNKFSTSMREVIGYIKYSKNKDKLLEFLRTDTHRSIEMNAVRVIKTITNTPIEVSEEEEEIEMCKAIEDLIAESEARGRAEGEVRGIFNAFITHIFKQGEFLETQRFLLNNTEEEKQMGTADMVTKEYMRENAVFADAFNYLIYNGKKVIDPAKLKEIDPTEIALPFGDEEKAGEDKKGKVQETEWSSVKNGSVRKKTAGRAGKKTDAVQKYRDILKSAVIKQDEKMSYVLLGIENQTDVHYAMPVRNAIYDALQYGRQVADIAAEHRRNKKDFTGKSNGEYLSGFLKEDCIKPVITLVIHFGAEEWDGPLSLHEMMSVSDIEILSFVENYILKSDSHQTG